jgi:hypothetical protein
VDAAAALLAALNVIRRGRPDLGLHAIVAFLLVCQHEGICLKELAFLCRSSQSAASRALAALGGRLIAFRYDVDDRRRVRMHLTEDGSLLKHEIALLLDRCQSDRHRGCAAPAN